MGKRLSRLEVLEKEGWTRQFIADEPRLSEAVALYQETGYEILLEPVPKKEQTGDFIMMGQKCMTCFEGKEDQYKIIFTRCIKGGATQREDSFC